MYLLLELIVFNNKIEDQEIQYLSDALRLNTMSQLFLQLTFYYVDKEQ